MLPTTNTNPLITVASPRIRSPALGIVATEADGSLPLIEASGETTASGLSGPDAEVCQGRSINSRRWRVLSRTLSRQSLCCELQFATCTARPADRPPSTGRGPEIRHERD